MQAAVQESFLNIAIKRKLYSNKSNLKFHLDYLFGRESLAEKKVLDVGGGKGLVTFYAATKGARKVVCLEPECDGSSKGMIRDFNEIKKQLSDDLPVELLPLRLQDYINQAPDNEYDIIIMHNSINHLDEEACINLLKDENSYQTYDALFSKVYQKMAPGGKLIIADCSNHNFLNALGVRNFLVPTIEWHKHQAPEVWIALLKKVGFKNPRVEWKTPNTFGLVGKVFLGNPVASYLTNSSFKFTMEK